MSAPIDILQRELEDQKTKLDALKAGHKDAIEAGQRAQREVDNQVRHVNEIQNAITHLKSVGRGIPVAA